jgi:hypothetical protein
MEGTQMSFLRSLVGLRVQDRHRNSKSRRKIQIVKHRRNFEQIRENGRFSFTERTRIDCQYWFANISAMDDGTLEDLNEDGKTKVITY